MGGQETVPENEHGMVCANVAGVRPRHPVVHMLEPLHRLALGIIGPLVCALFQPATGAKPNVSHIYFVPAMHARFRAHNILGTGEAAVVPATSFEVEVGSHGVERVPNDVDGAGGLEVRSRIVGEHGVVCLDKEDASVRRVHALAAPAGLNQPVVLPAE